MLIVEWQYKACIMKMHHVKEMARQHNTPQ